MTLSSFIFLFYGAKDDRSLFSIMAASLITTIIICKFDLFIFTQSNISVFSLVSYLGFIYPKITL